MSRRNSNTASAVPPVNVNAGSNSRRPSIHFDLSNPNSQVVDIVSKHLVQPEDSDASNNSKARSPSMERSDFNSLQLQGGDITRELYRWQNDHNTTAGAAPGTTTPPLGSTPPASDAMRRRSMSFSGSIRSGASNTRRNYIDVPEMSANEMRAPGGFRRSFLIHKNLKENKDVPNFIARNFIEFLTLYGHFAGENLSEDEDEEPEESDEESLLLPRRKERPQHKATVFKTIILLIKSFVGTGVLFLPKGFHNGGWGFSSVALLFCSVVSYWCFMLLINTKNKIQVNGYGDLGGQLYGRKMKFAILSSIVLSQIGFAAAYTVFTATNLQAFFANIFHWDYPLVVYILLQMVVYIPLSLTRSIAKLSGTVLIADFFILVGLLYLYYYCAYYVSVHGIASDSMVLFNSSNWTLFIGTAIFTYEGIGLLIPIQESMKQPEKFPRCLFGVMLGITVIFISCGCLCYSAFGADVKTVILLNFPQDSIFTGGVQFSYALAILLSTPLQLFPAIRILENAVFPSHASGKHNPKVKWLKNYFRCFVVIASVAIAWIGANDLDKFVSLVGSLACIPLIYIYPPMLHYKAFRGTNISRRDLVLDQVVLWFGIAIMVYISLQTVLMWSQ